MPPLPSLPRRGTALVCASSLIFILAACAGTPAPSAQMAVAEASVRHADTRSTSEHAPAELQVAIAKLTSARQAMIREEYDLARRLAEQAEVDAQVAMLRSQSTRARQAAQESQDAARVLSEELDRKTVR